MIIFVSISRLILDWTKFIWILYKKTINKKMSSHNCHVIPMINKGNNSDLFVYAFLLVAKYVRSPKNSSHDSGKDPKVARRAEGETRKERCWRREEETGTTGPSATRTGGLILKFWKKSIAIFSISPCRTGIKRRKILRKRWKSPTARLKKTL